MTIQYEYAGDVPRRVVFDDASPNDRREEWRCTRCEQWFPRMSVILVASRDTAQGMPMLIAYCAPCLSATGVNSADVKGH
jgi:hypothetical protein